MSYNFQYSNAIDLFVKDRISETDATRQILTSKAILARLLDQPGVILADEVGMGKTFVALAVAVSIYLKDKKSVVIMIPPNLINKWPNDFKLFCSSCITDPIIGSKLKSGVARRPEEFLKLLDDEEERQCAVIFLTHGAFSRSMSDGWIKLAIIQKSLYRRWGTEDLYRSLGRFMGSLLGMQYLESRNRSIEIWGLLLNSSPDKWKRILVKHKFLEETADDPVPQLFVQELEKLNTAELDSFYRQLRSEMPMRESDNIRGRLTTVRQILSEEAKSIWARCLTKIKLELPLLIFDEAHHLKNSETQLVSKLFHNPEAEEDAGILTGQFDRMLFLTATPFQLGHHELFRVLQRFETINWKSKDAPQIGQENYKIELENLLRLLDDSQIAARKLDHSWGKLTYDDLIIKDIQYQDIYEWWKAILSNENVNAPHIQKVIEDFSVAKEKLKLVETLLKKYVVRHLKPREMTDKFSGVKRRSNLPGKLISTANNAEVLNMGGLEISNEAMLPFLLAARLTTIQQDKRPVFAEGLASSFEAFRNTREERLKKEPKQSTDSDDDVHPSEQPADKVASWYLDQLENSLSASSKNGSLHPKVKPTVDKAIELWSQGEKVLIFCHYVATGKALRKYISDAMKEQICIKGSEFLKCNPKEVFDVLERLAEKITDKDSKLGKKCQQLVGDILDNYKELLEFREDIITSILRYMRTPSFLIRFASKGHLENDDEMIETAFGTSDNSGITFRQMLNDFLLFLTNRKEDRQDYISALMSIQPGGIRVKDISLDADGIEIFDDSDPTVVMANVRLCYGETKQETRQKLMKTFNTPFFPDILITSSVMAEGVDLHLSCRHIIHHDLCWNPSTLEQRTGRVDRIGAKAEKCGKSIQVYLPYISETQDEKMYRVVTERERWFNIVMGEKYKVDAASTDKYAQRIPLPEELGQELSFNLSVS